MHHRSWFSGRSAKKQRTAKLRLFRPGLEALEDRTLLSFGFTTLANGVGTELDKLKGPIGVFAGQSTAKLPILNDSIANLAGEAQTALDKAINALQSKIKNLDVNAPKTVIQDAVFSSGVIRDLDGNGANRDDVQILDSDYDVANGNIRITVHLGKSVTVAGKSFTFDLGLPGIPFNVTGDAKLKVSVDVDYDRVSFGLRHVGPDQHLEAFVESPADHVNKLTVGVSADATAATIVGTMGFFQVAATAMPGQNAAHLGASLVFGVNGVSLSSPTMAGSAQLNLKLDAKIQSSGNGLSFPHMVSNFIVDWNLAGAHNANHQALGSAPTVKFDQVQFGLGSFLGSMIKPVADFIRQATVPVAPIYALLAAPLPGLSDLSEAAGLGTITLEKLAALAAAGKVLPPDYQLLAELAINLHTLVALLRDAKFGPQNDVLIPVGSFDLSGANGDLRHATLAGGFTTLQDWFKSGGKHLTDLVPIATSAVQSIEDKISLGDLPGPAKAVVQKTFAHIKEQLRRMQNGIGLRFPLLEDPLSVFRLLLGQDVKFAQFDATFIGSAEQTEKLKVWGPVEVQFTGKIDLELQLHAGVDTFGLRQFFQKIIEGKGQEALTKLDDGFYLDASKDLARINGSITAQAGVDFAFGEGLQFFAFVGFQGKLATEPVQFRVSFADPNKRGDHLLRVFADGELQPGEQFFKVEASVTAAFDFVVNVGARVNIPGTDIILVEDTKEVYHLNIAHEVLINSKSIDTSNPYGATVEPDNSIDVIFDTTFLAGGGDGGDDIVFADVFTDATGNRLGLYFNGELKQSYKLSSVRSVTLVGSDDDTQFFVRGTVRKPVIVVGGSGSDFLDFDDVKYSDAAFPNYLVSGTRLQRVRTDPNFGFVATTTIDYSRIEQVVVQGAYKSNFIASNLSVPTTLAAGAGGAKFILGFTDHKLDSVFSYLKLVGGEGVDKLFLYDDAHTRSANYYIGHYGLDRSTRVPFYSSYLPGGVVFYEYFSQHLAYDGIDSVHLYATANGNGILVDDVIDYSGESSTNPMEIVLETGVGDDGVQIRAASQRVTVNGQAGFDVVTVGSAQFGTGLLFDSVNVNNAGGYTTLNIDDSGATTPRTVKMNVVGATGVINGLTPFSGSSGAPGPTAIRYQVASTDWLSIKAGSGANEFSILDTAHNFVPDPFVNLSTTITAGAGLNTFDIYRTTGRLVIDSQSPLTDVTIGVVGNLTPIKGNIELRGVAGGVFIKDGGNSLPYTYTMDAAQFYRFDATGASTAQIYFADLVPNSMNITLGNGGNIFAIDGTPTLSEGFNSGINVYTGKGNDFVYVRGTGGDLYLNMGPGSYQYVAFGDAAHSLDAIHGLVAAYGNGFIDAVVSNEASTQAQVIRIDVLPGGQGQSVERSQFNVDHYDQLNRFTFAFFDQGTLSFRAGQAGDTTFLSGNPAHVTNSLFGGAGADYFWIEGDQVPLLSPVLVDGGAANNDNAFYYDYVNPSSQSYRFFTPPSAPNDLRAERTGAAPVTYRGLGQVIFYATHVGGNFINVESLPSTLFLNMVNAPEDLVILGRPIPEGGGRTLQDIKGPVSSAGIGHIDVILDNSADPTGRAATVHHRDNNYGDFITGLMPGSFYWRQDEAASIAIFAGAGDDSFAIGGAAFVPAISIHGGGGNNTLDYSSAVSIPGLVSWYKGEADYRDAFGGAHGYGTTGFAPGKVGLAFPFNGGQDTYVRVANSATLEPATVSVEAWVNSSSVGSNAYVLSKGASNASAASYALYTGDSSGLFFYVYNGSGFVESPDAGTQIWDGQWHHVVGTFDGSTVRLYVDGTEVGEGTATNIQIAYNLPISNDLVIGNYQGTVKHPFNGLIDEPAIFNRALSGQEVQKHHAAGSLGLTGVAEGIHVNLAAGTASGLKGGITGFQNVIGSAFNDILLGGGAPAGSTLTGGDGRDILIAGAIAGLLNGGIGDDLLIGGATDYDTDKTALDAVMAEWSRTDLEYGDRVNNLVNGLLAGKVHSNGGGNGLYGEDAADLFFGRSDFGNVDFGDRVEDETLVQL